MDNNILNLINGERDTEIELYNEEDKYNNIESVINLLRINPVIFFNTFNEICESLNVKVSIE